MGILRPSEKELVSALTDLFMNPPLEGESIAYTVSKFPIKYVKSIFMLYICPICSNPIYSPIEAFQVFDDNDVWNKYIQMRNKKEIPLIKKMRYCFYSTTMNHMWIELQRKINEYLSK